MCFFLLSLLVLSAPLMRMLCADDRDGGRTFAYGFPMSRNSIVLMVMAHRCC